MEDKKENLNDTSRGSSDDQEKSQANSGSKVREGQENSSILHDKKDPEKEIQDVTQKDTSSENKEEFIDESNTRKEE